MTNGDVLAADIAVLGESLYFSAKLQLRGRLVSKVDVQGLLQKTFVEAWSQQDRWRSTAPLARQTWIRRAFQNNLVDEIRRFRRQSRDVSRELDFDSLTDRPGCPIAHLPAEHESPPETVLREERAEHLKAALARLPDLQRLVIELHHLQGLTLAEVATKLKRTKGSVAGLIYRGLRHLRTSMQDKVAWEV